MSGAGLTPEMLDVERSWVRSLWDQLRPSARDGGSYVNFLADLDDERVRASCDAKKYARLASIKKQYDPDNVFQTTPTSAPRSPTALCPRQSAGTWRSRR